MLGSCGALLCGAALFVEWRRIGLDLAQHGAARRPDDALLMNLPDPHPDTEAKLRFLQSPAAREGDRDAVEVIETHMSWVFLAGDRVLKLKKPVCHAFLDFSTLHAREFYCREEVRLNARLAPGVYLGVLALQSHDGAFALLPPQRLPAPGETVDWLVLMRRLPAAHMLDKRIAAGKVMPADIDALVAVLAHFYRGAPAVDMSAQEYVHRLRRESMRSREVLLDPRWQLPGSASALDRLDVALRRHAHALGARAAQGRVLDGHGDLRPEHVCLVQPPMVIDCLEFNAALRQVDPFDEIAFLGLECEMAGAPWIAERLSSGCAVALEDWPGPVLMHLYTAQRALLRARLAMAHLLDPVPRTPEKWLPRALRYIERASDALDALSAPSPPHRP
jgi:aminoglycoside phosphotransferase family enzyme